MRAEDFQPGAAEHPYCSFSRSYLLQPDGTLSAYADPAPKIGCCCSSSKSMEITARRWRAAPSAGRAATAATPAATAAAPAVVVATPAATAITSAATTAVDATDTDASDASDAPTDRFETPDSFDSFLARTRRYTLTVSGMAFQDAWNLDLDRLRYCYIHVVSPDRRIIPFCAYNLTSLDGDALYRGKTT